MKLMGCEQRLELFPELKLKIEPKLTLFIGELSGDIPIYSLHRIKNFIEKNPINISNELENMLIRNLISENNTYKTDTGNDWSCLTSNNLVDAIDDISREITNIISKGIESYPLEFSNSIQFIKNKLDNKKEEDVKKIQEWFFNNYEFLLYDISKKIPYPIIKKLRSNLALWVTKKINPFNEDINDFVIDVAKDYSGINYSNSEDAWKSMGGKLFK